MTESQQRTRELSFDDLRLCLEALDDLAALVPAMRRETRRRLIAMAARIEVLPFVVTALVIGGALLTEEAWEVLVCLVGGLAGYASLWAVVVWLGRNRFKPPDNLGRVLELRLFELNRLLRKSDLGGEAPEHPVGFKNVGQLGRDLDTLRRKLRGMQVASAAEQRKRRASSCRPSPG
jgi:hypothetical protein